MSITRRAFLKNSVKSTAAASLAPSLVILSPQKVKAEPSPLNKWPGRCVLNYNNQHNSLPNDGNASDEATVKAMVDDAIKLLTGQSEVGEAWKSIFPAAQLSQSTTIAIKANILNNALPPHPFIIMGMVEGL